MVQWLSLLHNFISTKPELRFCTSSNPACRVSGIRDGEDLWQWSRLEIGLKDFRRSTIPQKQFMIVINNNRTMYVNKQNLHKNKIKSHHIKIDHPLYCSIKPTNNTMVSLKDGFTVWCRQYISVWFSMSGHGANPILINKKKKNGHPEHLLTPHHPTSDNIFLSYPPLWKKTSCVYHP